MRRRLQTLRGTIARVFPGCVIVSQAVAFSMFVAFFPLLLFALGILSSSEALRGAGREMASGLRMVVPAGSETVVLDYLARKNVHPWRWILLGFIGTFLAGTQVMMGLMEGFRIIAKDEKRMKYGHLQLRALLLLCSTIAPWLAVVILTVFGKQVRSWLVQELGMRALFRVLGGVAFYAVVLVLGCAVLMTVYRVGRLGHRGWREVVPGAARATLLWWAVDAAFGLYVRHLPYRVVYGGLAAAIGLLLWMYITAVIVLLGAAYNAEASAPAESASCVISTGPAISFRQKT